MTNPHYFECVEHALTQASLYFGSQKKLADALNEVSGETAGEVTQSQISYWKKGKRRVPLGRAFQIEELTEGQITMKELCPYFKLQFKKTG